MRIGSGHGAARGSARRHALFLHRLKRPFTRYSHKVSLYEEMKNDSTRLRLGTKTRSLPEIMLDNSAIGFRAMCFVSAISVAIFFSFTLPAMGYNPARCSKCNEMLHHITASQAWCRSCGVLYLTENYSPPHEGEEGGGSKVVGEFGIKRELAKQRAMEYIQAAGGKALEIVNRVAQKRVEEKGSTFDQILKRRVILIEVNLAKIRDDIAWHFRWSDGGHLDTDAQCVEIYVDAVQGAQIELKVSTNGVSEAHHALD